MEKTLVVIPRNCTGCRTCDLACSFVHSEDGRLGRARITIFPTVPDRYMQMTCLQCVEAACIAVCPTGALVRNEKTRAVDVDDGRCIGCRLCEAACPFGHIRYIEEDGAPAKCDLCGGEPACASFCPYNALEYK